MGSISLEIEMYCKALMQLSHIRKYRQCCNACFISFSPRACFFVFFFIFGCVLDSRFYRVKLHSFCLHLILNAFYEYLMRHSMHVSIKLTIPCDPDWFEFWSKKKLSHLVCIARMCVYALVFVRVCFEMRNLFGYDIRVTFIRN